jgi:hypothetical protein
MVNCGKKYNMLAIQKLLRDKGLKYTKEYLNLMVKESEDLILLKYKQIEADWTKIETHQCRGIILEKKTYNIIALSYIKNSLILQKDMLQLLIGIQLNFIKN